MKNLFSAERLSIIRQGLKNSNIEIAVNRSTENPRRDLRIQIAQSSIQSKIKNKDQFCTDFNLIPQIDGGDLSLSHCPDLQGYAFLLGDQKVGFDLEVKSRVSLKLVSRIASDTEINQAPTHEMIWTAKEAAFKVFSKLHGCKLISQQTIDQWFPLGNGQYISTARFQNASISGISGAINSCFYSVFIS